MKRMFVLGLLLGISSIAYGGTFDIAWTLDTSDNALCADGKTKAVTKDSAGKSVNNCKITGIELAQKMDGVENGWKVIKGFAPGVTSYTVDDLQVGEVRCYRFRAQASGTWSKPSEEFCSSPMPGLAPGTVMKAVITITAEGPPVK